MIPPGFPLNLLSIIIMQYNKLYRAIGKFQEKGDNDVSDRLNLIQGAMEHETIKIAANLSN
jgi:hypothetical protein